MKKIKSFDFSKLDIDKYKYFLVGNDLKYDELFVKNGYLICIENIEGVNFIDFLEIKRNGDFEYKAVFDKLFECNEKLGISYHINSKVEILARRLKQIYEVDQEIILQDIKAIILKGGNKSGKRKSNKKNFESTKEINWRDNREK